MKSKLRFLYASLMMIPVVVWFAFGYFRWRHLIWKSEKDDLADLDNCAD